MRATHLLLAAVLAASVHAASAVDGFTDPRVSPPYLTEAKVFGKWQEDGKAGLLRYSMYQGSGAEVQTILLIEWIAVDRDSGEQSIDAQHEVAPIPGIFDSPQIVSDKALRIQVASELCGEPQRYEIDVVREGVVQVKYLNEKHCDVAGQGP